jgi:exopolysaccharide biosynthesis protein
LRAFVLRLILLIILLAAVLFAVPSGTLMVNADAAELDVAGLVPLPIDDTPGFTPNKACYLSDGTGYADASLQVHIETVRAYETTIQVIHIQIADPSQIRTAMSAQYGHTSTNAGATIARRNNAVLAVNGDYFNFHNRGYLVRQGKLYRNRPDGSFDTLIIDDHGDFHIIPKATGEELAAFQGVMVNTFNFGPGLVIDGKMTEQFEENDSTVPNKRTQRICIGQTGPLSYICFAAEGPENKGSQGLLLTEIAKMAYDYGCVNAYNLDGGSSSTVVLDNKKINALSSGKTRSICDILYFATAIPAE